MKRTQAAAAIDEAFADGLKRLFGTMVQRLEDKNEDRAEIAKAFRNGIAFHDDAHSMAMAEVETIFAE